MDTTELRRLATAATPGPWTAILPGDVGWSQRRQYRCVAFGKRGYTTSPLLPQDGRYIAAVSPDVVLRLLDVAEAARQWITEEVGDLNGSPYLYGDQINEKAVIRLRAALAALDAAP